MHATTLPEPSFGLTRDDMAELFRLKYGAPQIAGWGPRLRLSFDYFTPDDFYEATVAALLPPGGRWLDVGSGRSLFPDNPRLARQLADRCDLLVGLDPDDTIDENPYLDRQAKCTLQEFESPEEFDLVTLRMVAEHITEPKEAVASLCRLIRPGGKVVIYTVNATSPVAVAAKVVPFGLHHPIKKRLWQTEERDTFPVVYRMNTRAELTELFEGHGFQESFFAYLDDCRTFHRFGWLQRLELCCWRLCRSLGLSYPETCLLGIYERI